MVAQKAVSKAEGRVERAEDHVAVALREARACAAAATTS